MVSGKRAVSTAEAPAAIGPYSQAVSAEPWLFVSGQIPLDPASGSLVAGGIREQTERVLKNIGAILKAESLDYSAVVKTAVFLKDLGQFSEFNEVYSRYFPAPAPARSTVQVAALPKGALVEIEAVALSRPPERYREEVPPPRAVRARPGARK